MKLEHLKTKPPYVLAGGFLFIILIGTLLLELPFAHRTSISWLHALFTSTSAVTVTGLSVEDTANFTIFGQIVLMILIQIGGLGFMTFAIYIARRMGAKIGLFGNAIAQEALGDVPFNLLLHTAKNVLKFALSFELIAIIILTIHFYGEVSFSQALYQSLFFSISAFNNAGFALSSASLMHYVDDVIVNIVITALIIIGGLGFVVLMDIKNQRQYKKFSLNTKVVLWATLILNILSFVIFYILERQNPQTFGPLSELGKILAAWFQAITPRTAGFNTIDTSGLTDASSLLTMLLMFIGGGSLSTASGIKIGTFCIIVVATRAYLHKESNVNLFKHNLPDELIKKSFALFLTSLTCIFISSFLLLAVEPQFHFLDVLFEVVSALGTVGLSRGITPQVSPFGEFILIILMFVGRVGLLTMIYLIMQPHSSKIKYPKEYIQIG
ncbi:cation transport protein [Canicola haemoglobinophilus]|uniref:Cation transport protein n=1 Tax=Canicola haemoglobinophilus TaxID=733 RepID=A0AB38HBK5_9PAST|nr:TrkH family potassium uptake protein [Canicola haemoglobinophilus]STO54765.1 cation transport protein [Canicola haemoglobinophilus]STO69663.1 cation transport protein [Canicola haemoglobinophilus]